MKRFLAFLLTTALVLTMGVTSFAIKGGDGNEYETVLFDFSTKTKASALIGSGRFYGIGVDETIVKKGSSSSVQLTQNASTAIVNGGQSPFSAWDGVITDWSTYDGIKINLYVSAKDNTTSFAGKTARIIFGANAVYNDSSDGNNNKDYWRYDLDIESLNTGWNEVEIPFASFGSVIDGSAVSNKSLADYKADYNINSLTILNGTEATKASSTSPFPWTLNLDSIMLTKNPAIHTYSVASDAAVLWEFNSADAVSAVSFATAANNPRMTVDTSYVNAYDVSAKLTTNGLRRLQIYPANNAMQAVNSDGDYLYDYINILVGNPSNETVGFGMGIHFSATAYATLDSGWNLVSFPIERLFRLNSSSSAGKRAEYSDITKSAMQISNVSGGADDTTSGIVYNFDMIWVSKTPAAVGSANNVGTIVNRLPLNMSDATVVDNGDGTSYATCKISNWPGERFVVIFASYEADGALHGLTFSKDYDGAENKDKIVNTPSIEVPQGGKTKIMVWNGFGEIAPMVTSVEK